MDQVATCFEVSNRTDFHHNEIGLVDPVYNFQSKAHTLADHPAHQQRCLHPYFFLQMFNYSSSVLQVALSRYAIIEYFCTMRSCELSKASRDRKSSVVTLACILFSRKDNSTIDHNDNGIFAAFAVSITFMNQTNSEKEERTTQEKLGILS